MKILQLEYEKYELYTICGFVYFITHAHARMHLHTHTNSETGRVMGKSKRSGGRRKGGIYLTEQI